MKTCWFLQISFRARVVYRFGLFSQEVAQATIVIPSQKNDIIIIDAHISLWEVLEPGAPYRLHKASQSEWLSVLVFRCLERNSTTYFKDQVV